MLTQLEKPVETTSVPMNKNRLLSLTHADLAELTEQELVETVTLADLPMCQGVALERKDRPTLTRLAHLARQTVQNQR